MKTAICFVILATSAFSQFKSLDTTAAIASVTYADLPVYRNLTDVAISFKLDGITQACGLSSTTRWMNIETTNEVTGAGHGLFSLGCQPSPSFGLRYTVGGGAGVVTLEPGQSWTSVDSLIGLAVRVPGSKYIIKLWKTDGTLFASNNIIPIGGGGTLIGQPQRLKKLTVTGNGEIKVAWLRVHTSGANQGGFIPKDTLPSTVGLVARYEFDDDLTDSSGNAQHLTRSGTPTYSVSTGPSTPMYQLSASVVSAGGTLTLDATSSFRFNDNTPFTSALWRCVTCPSEPLWSDRRSVTPTLTRIVAGTYVFSAQIEGATKAITVDVGNLDLEGYHLLASNTSDKTVPIRFSLASRPGATDVLVETRLPSGVVKEKVCASSPCNVTFDSRQASPSIRLTYRGSGGRQWRGDWAQVTNVATTVDTPLSPRVSYARQAAKTVYGAFQAGAPQLGSRARFQSRYIDRFYGVDNVDLRQYDLARPIQQSFYFDLQGARPLELAPVSHLIDNYEDGFQHARVDYDIARDSVANRDGQNIGESQYRWKDMEQFGHDESANGVMYATGDDCSTGCSDRTSAAYYPVSTSVSPGQILIGSQTFFTHIRFELSAPAAGATASYQYWNSNSGAWVALPLTSDGTEVGGQKFVQSGVVTFAQPANWGTSTQAGSSRRWIRITFTGGKDPVPSRIIAAHGTTDKLMIGMEEPFDEVNWVFVAPASSTVDYEYWNGLRWSPLTLASDTTAVGGQRLAQDGQVRFNPPADWTRAPLSGERHKWWIRVSPTAGSFAPARVFGDNWQQPEMAAGLNRRLYAYTYFAADDGAQFTGVNLTLTQTQGTSSIGAVYVRWEYWNGSGWAALSVTSDGTRANCDHDGSSGTAQVPCSLRQSGAIAWTLPGDWSALAYNGSTMARKWVRMIHVTASGGSTFRRVNTAPVATAVTITGGTSSVALSTATGRGWDASHANRLNVGLGQLEYNPNPPSNASARFRHQSRGLGFFAPNNMQPNYQRTNSTGAKVWSDFMLKRSQVLFAQPNRQNHNSLFFDNAANTPFIVRPASPADINVNNAYIDGEQSSTPTNEEMLADFVPRFHAVFPGRTVGGNGTTADQAGTVNTYFVWNLCQILDWCKEEGFYTFNTFHTGSMYSLGGNPGFWASIMDKAKQGSPTNPNNTVVSLQWTDNSSSAAAYDGTVYMNAGPNYGRGNRWPMTALAGYYMGANENTRFSYLLDSLNFYSTTDEVWVRSATPMGTLSSDVGTASTQMCSAAFQTLAAGTYMISVGTVDPVSVTKLNDSATCLTKASGPISQTWAAGTPFYLVTPCYLGTGCAPTVPYVARWGMFPAAGIDVGVPDTVGSPTFAERQNWKSRADSGNTLTQYGLWRRDYTRAIMLFQMKAPSSHETQNTVAAFTVPANYVINFEAEGMCSGAGCALYPLRADGYTSNEECNYTVYGGSDYRTADGGCTAIRPIPASWGAILMKQSIQ